VWVHTVQVDFRSYTDLSVDLAQLYAHTNHTVRARYFGTLGPKPETCAGRQTCLVQFRIALSVVIDYGHTTLAAYALSHQLSAARSTGNSAAQQSLDKHNMRNACLGELNCFGPVNGLRLRRNLNILLTFVGRYVNPCAVTAVQQ